MERSYGTVAQLRAQNDDRYQLEALRAEQPLLSWPPQGRVDQACRSSAIPGRAPDLAPRHQPPTQMHLRQDGTLIRHKSGPKRCAGSEESPAEPISLASWLPLCPGLTPTAFATVIRPGLTTWASDTSFSPSGWAMRCLA